MRQWFVVCTDPRAEERVAWTLRALNFGVFLPMETKPRVVRGKRVRVNNPIFPRYVFVSFDHQNEEWWSPIKSVYGVQCILENNQVPVAVPNEIIEELRRREANGAFDKAKLPAAGDGMRVVGGPLSGLVGKVRDSNKSGLVRMFLDLLGKAVKAEIKIENLERI